MTFIILRRTKKTHSHQHFQWFMMIMRMKRGLLRGWCGQSLWLYKVLRLNLPIVVITVSEYRTAPENVHCCCDLWFPCQPFLIALTIDCWYSWMRLPTLRQIKRKRINFNWICIDAVNQIVHALYIYMYMDGSFCFSHVLACQSLTFPRIRCDSGRQRRCWTHSRDGRQAWIGCRQYRKSVPLRGRPRWRWTWRHLCRKIQFGFAEIY